MQVYGVNPKNKILTKKSHKNICFSKLQGDEYKINAKLNVVGKNLKKNNQIQNDQPYKQKNYISPKIIIIISNIKS